MTIQGALTDLTILLNADDIPCYYKPSIKKVIETIEQEPKTDWIPLKWEIEGISCDIPEELDGNWLLFTDGKSVSIERIKKDAQDHFYPDGRCFELEDAVAWMPEPEPYKTESEEK